MFRAKKNRRRVDVAKKTGELKAAAQQLAPTLLKLVLLVLVSVGAVVGAVYGWRWALTSQQFALEQVVVRGAMRVRDAEVVRLGNVLLGQNVLATDVLPIERALAAHPWVKEVSVQRRLPRTLEVRLVEHTPVAMVALGELYLLDDEGAPFKRLAAQDAADVPLVTGLERSDFAEHRERTQRRLVEAFAAAHAYQASPVSRGHSLSEVALSADGVSLVTSTGQVVALGEGDIEAKLERLGRVRRALVAQGAVASMIRLNNRRRPDWVAVEMQGSPSEKTR
jgi:cell division protein FtsQ